MTRHMNDQVVAPAFPDPVRALLSLDRAAGEAVIRLLDTALGDRVLVARRTGVTNPEAVAKAAARHDHDLVHQLAGSAIYNHLVTKYPDLGEPLGPGVRRSQVILAAIALVNPWFNPERFKKLDDRLDMVPRSYAQRQAKGRAMAEARRLPDLDALDDEQLDAVDRRLASEMAARRAQGLPPLTPAEEQRRFRRLARETAVS